MSEHRCEYIIKFDEFEAMEYCDIIARFKNDLGRWNCAEHYMLMQADIEKRLAYSNGNGICSVCNCEFYDGECNCEYYAEDEDNE